MQKFTVQHKIFKVFIGRHLVASSGYDILNPDDWFKERYVILHNLTTDEQYRNQGVATFLLEQIFYYVKNTLKVNIITLIVYKSNTKALNLYYKAGFVNFSEYDNSFSLIKQLTN